MAVRLALALIALGLAVWAWRGGGFPAGAFAVIVACAAVMPRRMYARRP